MRRERELLVAGSRTRLALVLVLGALALGCLASRSVAASATAGDDSVQDRAPRSSGSGELPEWILDDDGSTQDLPDEVPAVGPGGSTVMVPFEDIDIDPTDLMPGGQDDLGLRDDQVAIYGVATSGEWGIVRIAECVERGDATICE